MKENKDEKKLINKQAWKDLGKNLQQVTKNLSESTTEILNKTSKNVAQNVEKLGKDISEGAAKTKEVLIAESTKVIDSSVQKSKELTDKYKNDAYLRKLKKYNPVFPEYYNSENFHMPNMIKIVDDAVRKGIDVCEGSIGWISNENGMEVFNLYDEAIEFSGIKFYPIAQCDEIYYVDRFDRNQFINVNMIFTRAHEEKIAELKNVAYALGAKCCSVEISETTKDYNSSKQHLDVHAKAKIKLTDASSNESYDHSLDVKNSSHRTGRSLVRFSGNNNPKMPNLKWFAYDENIKGLIEMRLSGNNSVLTYELALQGATSAVMSENVACAIDNALGKMASVKGKSTIAKQATKEINNKFIFYLEF